VKVSLIPKLKFPPYFPVNRGGSAGFHPQRVGKALCSLFGVLKRSGLAIAFKLKFVCFIQMEESTRTARQICSGVRTHEIERRPGEDLLEFRVEVPVVRLL
jgi:hypothetical protein